MYSVCCFFFFFKQKTAYEMRISDWSSDVCSSDLSPQRAGRRMQASATMTADDHQAFGKLLQQHRGIVFKVAGTYARSAEDRDDLAQEIAVQLWRARPGYDPSRRLSTWLYRIALNVALSFRRSDGHRRRHAVPPDAAIHDMADDNGPDQETAERPRVQHPLNAPPATPTPAPPPPP